MKRKPRPFNPAVWNDFTIWGDPVIYSCRYDLGMRRKSLRYFKKQQYQTLLRAQMPPSYVYAKGAFVLLVKFYVRPPSTSSYTASELRREKIPAFQGFELCEYLLSLKEVLYRVMIPSYAQVAKVDMEKYYSDNPRTVFKLMKWDEYVRLLASYNTDNAEAKEVR